MKRSLVWLSVVLALGCVALMVLACVWSPSGRCDFNLRLNEVGCLRQGVNPYAIWHEDLFLPPYCSNIPRGELPAGCTEQVNASVPWAYTLMLPLSFVPREAAWVVYCCCMGLSLWLIAHLVFHGGNDFRDKDERWLVSIVPLVMMGYLLWSNVAVGNFIVFVLAASVAMAWCLQRGHDVLAGLCWALAMIKPQSAVLFAVPLLMRRKWTTCFVASLTCLVASLVPMRMCRASLLDLLLQGPAANAELFLGCGTYPRFCLGLFGNSLEIGLGLLIGFGLCCWMTAWLRRADDWFLLLMPAAVCGASWTYTQAYSHALGWFLAFALVRALVRHPKEKVLWGLFALALLFLTRWFLAWHGLSDFMSWKLPMSEYAFRCLDALNSTASLALALIFCRWLLKGDLSSKRML